MNAALTSGIRCPPDGTVFRTRRETCKQYNAAWIALLSMLLLVVAPVISQVQLAGSISHSAHAHMPAMEHDARRTHQAVENHSGSHVNGDSHAHHDPLNHTLEACGYCFLLASSPTLVGAIGAGVAHPLFAGLSIVPRPAWQAARAGTYVVHRPRGPPLSLTVV